MTTPPTTLHRTTPRSFRIERIFEAPRARVWEAMTDPAQIALWWGRGNHVEVVRFEPVRGGHWRFLEHAGDTVHGFEGRFREVVAPERVVQTFEWDGMPGHVVINTMTLEDLGDGRTKLVTVSEFFSDTECDGMLDSGMQDGLERSYAALDRVLARRDAPRSQGRVRKVAFTMLPATDAVRARRFYEQALGLTVGLAGGQGDMFWIEFDLPGGGCIALNNTNGATPSRSAGATVALEVDDLPACLQRLREAGVEVGADVIRGPHCRMATCTDSEGNGLLLHELDRTPA